MTTFDESWSGRLRIIGDLERPDHWYLTPQDSCAFFGEYTARAGYGHSSTNQLILNLKKKPELAGSPQYVWKGRAISHVAATIRENLKMDALGGLAVVPIPPSKRPGSPGYDDRIARIARAIAPGLDVREAIVTAVEREPMHANQNHRDPEELRATLSLVPALTAHAPAQVILLDDVLTTGCTYMVCKGMLQEVWPGAEIFGLFVARRIVPAMANLDLDDLI